MFPMCLWVEKLLYSFSCLSSTLLWMECVYTLPACKMFIFILSSSWVRSFTQLSSGYVFPPCWDVDTRQSWSHTFAGPSRGIKPASVSDSLLSWVTNVSLDDDLNCLRERASEVFISLYPLMSSLILFIYAIEQVHPRLNTTWEGPHLSCSILYELIQSHFPKKSLHRGTL